MSADRLQGTQRAVVFGVCIAAGAAYLQPATYNYLVNPMLITFSAGQEDAAPLREAPSIASLLVIFLAAVMATRFGQRRTLSAAAGTLFVGSLIVAASPSLLVAVVGLSVQAAAATVLLVVPLAVIGATVTSVGSRASAFAIFSMVSPLVFVVLPVLASVLMEHYTWRVVAGIWAAGAIVALVAGRVTLPRDAEQRPRLELLTPTLAGVACVGVVQTVSHAGSDGVLSAATLGRLGIAVLALVLVGLRLRSGTRSLDVDFLRGGGVVLLLAVVALWCFTQLWYYMTLAYEYVFGLSVVVTALLMVPAQACAAIGARAAGRMVKRFGVSATGCWLLVATGVSLGVSVLVTVESPLWWPVLVTCMYSFTSVGAGVPMTNALMDAAHTGTENSASAYRQAAISVGTAVGITLISALVFAVFSASLSSNLQSVGQDTAEAQQIAADLRKGVTTTAEAAAYALPLDDVESINAAQKGAYLDGMAAHGVAGLVLSMGTAALFWASQRKVRS